MTTHIRTIDDLRRAIAQVRLNNIIVTDADLIEFDLWVTATQIMSGGVEAVASLLKYGCHPIDDSKWVDDLLSSFYDGEHQAPDPQAFADMTSAVIEQFVHIWVTGVPNEALERRLVLMQSSMMAPKSGIIVP